MNSSLRYRPAAMKPYEAALAAKPSASQAGQPPRRLRQTMPNSSASTACVTRPTSTRSRAVSCSTAVGALRRSVRGASLDDLDALPERHPALDLSRRLARLRVVPHGVGIQLAVDQQAL